jgi:hypothetical protein
MRASVVAACYLFLTWLLRADANEPIPATLCEIVGTPGRFDGKIVRIRATIQTGLEASVLVDEGCQPEANVWFEFASSYSSAPPASEYALIKSLADLRQAAMLTWIPIDARPVVKLQIDSNYKKLHRFLNKPYKTRDGVICMGCPLYSVTATFTGRFDHSDGIFKVVRHDGAGSMTVGVQRFGHLGGWDSQIIVGSVSEVVGTKIDPAKYEQNQ